MFLPLIQRFKLNPALIKGLKDVFDVIKICYLFWSYLQGRWVAVDADRTDGAARPRDWQGGNMTCARLV